MAAQQQYPWQPPRAAYSGALLQESGVPDPLLLNACAERADLIEELHQSLMQWLGLVHRILV